MKCLHCTLLLSAGARRPRDGRIAKAKVDASPGGQSPSSVDRARLSSFLVSIAFCLLSLGGLAPGEELDFSDQLPRVAPLSPEDALGTFHLVEGFRIELVASEPLMADPVAMAFDADGRLYVVEMRGYSEDAADQLGRIRLLIDTDDDGRYDRSTVFASGLSWPTAITCADGGVYVAAAPDLIFLRDNNQDGIADEHSLWYQGFGRDNVQGLVNTLTWGLDNRIHGATSSTGASLRNPLDPRQPVLELRGRDFAFDPRTHKLSPTSGGGQHGLSFNRWGEKFVCSNSDHIQQILLEDRYLERNPYMTPLPARVSIAADGPQATVYRSSPIESWRVIRTRLRVSGVVPGPIEGGGTAAGYFTGATGVVAYRGNAWPPTFLDYALVCDVGSNLVHRKRLVDLGTRYRAERVDDYGEFLTSDDIWFRPVQLTNGPDGALYVIDMYREVIEHPASLPPVIKRHLDLTSGRNRGRIYRIVPDAFIHPPGPRLSGMTTAQWVQTLSHPNGWHRETAARLLYERNDASIAPDLREMLQRGDLAEGRLRALYALASLNSLTREDLLVALGDAHPQVRRHAVRLSEQLAEFDAELQQVLFRLVDDPSIKVRYQLAFSLGMLSDSPQRQRTLAELAHSAESDAYVLAAVQTSLLDGAAVVLDDLARDEDFRQRAAGRGFLRQLAAQLRRQEDTKDLPRLHRLIGDLARQDAAILPELLLELTLARDNQLSKRLREGDSGNVIHQLIEQARAAATDAHRPVADRQAAIAQLALADWDEVAELVEQLLEASQPQPVQLQAIDLLDHYAAPSVGQLLLAGWDRYSPTLRQPIIQQLMSRSAWQAALLESLELHNMKLSDLTPAQQQQLARVAGSERWQALESSLNVPTTPDFAVLLETYRSAMQQTPNPDAGRQVFRTACASCHRLEDFGYELGPNLAAVQNRGEDAILVNVLDPNREVNPQYVAYSAVTQDGRIVSGMIRSETATSIELVQAENKSETLLRDDIESLNSTSQSLMPTGLEKQVPPAAMNDLISYLRSLAP